jgi:hypothetical protein
MTFISYLINCIRWSFLDQYGDEEKHLVFGNTDGAVDPSYTVPEPDERPEAIKLHLNKTARRIVDLVKAGKSTNEISADMKFSRQRVHQIFGEIRATYNKLCKKGKI